MTATAHRIVQPKRESIPAPDVDRLRKQVQGAVLEPSDSGYDDARLIWNGMISYRPGLIVMCENTGDAVAAVTFARQHALPLSIRGGGHNIAGTAICEAGLMISFAQMTGVNVDSGTGRVRVEPGANWGDVDAATEAHGLVVPGGIVSTTGVAGFTLGGGFGWLTRKWGYTSDSLVSATVVTADGRVLTASAESEPDLFWGIRGGGGNFGVVTEFEFEAQRLGPDVAAGIVLWPMETAAEVIELFRRETASAPVELCYVLVMRVAPPAPFLPVEVHGKPVVGIAACYGGDISEGLKLMEPVKTYGTPLVDTIKAKPFNEHQSFLDSGQPFGRRYYWKSVYLGGFSDGVQDALLKHGTEFSSSLSSILLPHLGGNARNLSGDDSAVSNRNAEYLVNYQASWEDPAADDEHVDWARRNFNAMLPHASGHYVNFMTEDEVRDPSRQAYDADILARLSVVKQQYDPVNLFRLNKNIEPANEVGNRT